MMEDVLVPLTLLLTFVLAVAALLFVRSRPPRALNPDKDVLLTLVEKEEVSHDTRRFRFALPSPGHALGLPVGQHISLSYTDENGKLVMRPYTPTSTDKDLGYVDFVIKVYFANVHPKFPAGGKMSQKLESLSIGDKFAFKGPKGKYTYVGGGEFRIANPPSKGGGYVTRRAKRVGMIAGGTGITPMLQIMRHMFSLPSDTTDVSLLFANQTPDDILLRDAIEADKKAHPQFSSLWYTVDRPGDGKWDFDTGFINADMIKRTLPAPGPDTLILVCGPPPMVEYAVKPAFASLGYTDAMVLVW